ncbi:MULTISPECIES: hypothetical protein [unclassified Acidovorax]|uniref:hypothetical protein n=1 Tax=unclassified Acidovorax TaxID=2684926 RepID=UPI0018ED1708|nr:MULTISPECIES: hypothetical protein [unclassified Acidovorax]
MRNPDYLAAELIDLFLHTQDKTCLGAAQEIFDNEEPDLRRVPMVAVHSMEARALELVARGHNWSLDDLGGVGALENAVKDPSLRTAETAQLFHLLDGLVGYARQLGVRVSIVDVPYTP